MKAQRIGKCVSGGEYSKKKCAQCGELFTLPCTLESWPFRIDHKFFCKYSCKRAYENTHKVKSRIDRDYLLRG